MSSPSTLMRRTIRLVVFCCHERICIHAHRGLWRRRGGWKGRVRIRAYLPRCTLQSVWKGRGEGGGSVRCWIAYLRSQSPPFARALSPLRGPAMDVTPGCAFFFIFLHFQHADTLYIANSIGTWKGFYLSVLITVTLAGDTDPFGCPAVWSSNSCFSNLYFYRD